MNKLISLFAILSVFAIHTHSNAQEVMQNDPNAVKSIDGIVNEVLRYVTGEKGKICNVEAFRNLFLPSNTFTVLMHNKEDGDAIKSISLDEFVQLLKDPSNNDFEEWELHKVVDEYNGIAQVFQTYQSKNIDGMKEQGVNSYQLIYINDRWWITSILWTGDSNGVEIPKKYLGE